MNNESSREVTTYNPKGGSASPDRSAWQMKYAVNTLIKEKSR